MIFWCHDQDVFCATWYNISNIDNKPGFVCVGYNIFGARETGL